jgi:hypothetical protein
MQFSHKQESPSESRIPRKRSGSTRGLASLGISIAGAGAGLLRGRRRRLCSHFSNEKCFAILRARDLDLLARSERGRRRCTRGMVVDVGRITFLIGKVTLLGRPVSLPGRDYHMSAPPRDLLGDF